MIYKNIEFFNVTELEVVDGFDGVRLQRFPKHVRDALGIEKYERGRLVSQHSTGSELRFVTDSRAVRIFLSAADADGEALVYRGNYFHSRFSLKTGVITPLLLEEPPAFSNVTQEALETGGFSSKVWRIQFNRYCAVFHGIDAFGHSVRPPEKKEVPGITWLAYGSSITHGASSGSFENSYVQQAAKRLKADVLCCGLSGACYCEKEAADFIASREAWDIVTLEMGVNMRTVFTAEEFEQRVSYLVTAVLEKNPGKPVVMISLYPNHADFPADPAGTVAVKSKEFNEILRKVYHSLKCPDLYLFDGKDILTDFSALTCDLLHPSAYGHILMGETLANRLRPLLNNYIAIKEGKESAKNAAAAKEKNPVQVPEDMIWLHDVEIGKGGSRTLKMDLVLPKEKGREPRPVIVYIHGGGWNHGTKNDHVSTLVRFAERGYAGVAIEYRLTHEAVFPGQLEDCKLAIRYLRAKAQEHHVNPDRIGVWGNSAGGHLAALLGTTGSRTELEGTGGWMEYPSHVQAVVDWSGPVDFTTEFANKYASVTKLLGMKALDDREKAERAMPSTYITAEMPPFLIMHGEKDELIPYTDSISLYEAIKKAGAEVTLQLVPEAGHSITGEENVETVMAFFEKVLRNGL